MPPTDGNASQAMELDWVNVTFIEQTGMTLKSWEFGEKLDGFLWVCFCMSGQEKRLPTRCVHGNLSTQEQLFLKADVSWVQVM